MDDTVTAQLQSQVTSHKSFPLPEGDKLAPSTQKYRHGHLQDQKHSETGSAHYTIIIHYPSYST